MRRIWGLEYNPRMDNELSTYFTHCQQLLGNRLTVTMFFVDLLKRNAGLSKGALKTAVKRFRAGRTPTLPGQAAEADSDAVELPPVSEALRDELSKCPLTADSFLSLAVGLVWATHLVTDTSQFSGPWRSTRVTWADSQSLQDVFEATFPRREPLNATQSQIKGKKLCARYLTEHAGIELVWTRHLPDHLDLNSDGKKLYIFELVSLLDVARNSPGALGSDLAGCLNK